MGFRRFAMRVTAGLSVALAIAGTAGAAVEHPRWTRHGDSLFAPIGDGRSVVAWQGADRVVHAVTADGVLHVVRPPAGCPPNVSVAGGGAVLFACTKPGTIDTGDRYAIVDVRTGAVAELRGPPEGSNGEVWWPTALGEEWVQGFDSGYHTSVTTYDRRPGHTGAPPGRQDAREVPDLDRPSLYRRLCAGARLHRAPPEGIDVVDPFRPGAGDDAFAAVADARYRWTLRRCRRPTALRVGGAPTLGGGLATWSAGPGRIGVLQRDGRRRAVAAPVGTSWAPRRAGRVLVITAGRPAARGFPIWTAVLPRR